MAGPITHTFLAAKALDTIASERDPKTFIIGTLFPDIRYLEVLERSETHYDGVQLLDVIAEIDDFEAGVMFHSYIDSFREDFVRKRGVYDSIGDTYESTVALKLAEDIWTYGQLDSLSEFSDYMTDIIRQEQLFEIDPVEITKWHDIHKDLFADYSMPKIDSFLTDIYIEPARKSRIVALITDMNDKGIAKAYMPDLIKDVQSELNANIIRPLS